MCLLLSRVKWWGRSRLFTYQSVPELLQKWDIAASDRSPKFTTHTLGTNRSAAEAPLSHRRRRGGQLAFFRTTRTIEPSVALRVTHSPHTHPTGLQLAANL